MRKNALPLHGAGRGMTFCYPLPRLPLFSVSAFRKMKSSDWHFGQLGSWNPMFHEFWKPAMRSANVDI
jgi:hypothetical protein